MCEVVSGFSLSSKAMVLRVIKSFQFCNVVSPFLVPLRRAMNFYLMLKIIETLRVGQLVCIMFTGQE